MNAIQIKRISKMVMAELGSDAARLGLVANDADIFVSEKIWTRNDREHVRRCFSAVRDSLADLQGFEPFELPAEYLAAVIINFVNPVNFRAASSWVASGSYSASEIASGDTSGQPLVTAAQLYSLIIMAVADEEGQDAVLNSKVIKSKPNQVK